MPLLRLDQFLLKQGKTSSRSQAENYIKLGYVTVNGLEEKRPSRKVSKSDDVLLTAGKTYVSRAAHKLESACSKLGIGFTNKAVLDVGSSTGGFTDYALQHGASKVIAVDVGTNQMNQQLRLNQKVELHEQTDIRKIHKLSTKVDFVTIDVSFISIREVLSHIPKLIDQNTQIIAMVKPQFESSQAIQRHKGVIKNEAIRRNVLKDFEHWAKDRYKIISKADSDVAGGKGNKERFYLLKLF